jgi:hypothetical protein
MRYLPVYDRTNSTINSMANEEIAEKLFLEIDENNKWNLKDWINYICS